MGNLLLTHFKQRVKLNVELVQGVMLYIRCIKAKVGLILPMYLKQIPFTLIAFDH